MISCLTACTGDNDGGGAKSHLRQLLESRCGAAKTKLINKQRSIKTLMQKGTNIKTQTYRHMHSHTYTHSRSNFRGDLFNWIQCVRFLHESVDTSLFIDQFCFCPPHRDSSIVGASGIWDPGSVQLDPVCPFFA